MEASNILVNTATWKKCDIVCLQNFKKSGLNIREENLKNGWTKIHITLGKNSEYSDLGLARELIIREYNKQGMKPKQNQGLYNQTPTILMSSRVWNKNSDMFSKCMQQFQCAMHVQSGSTNLVEINISTQEKVANNRVFQAREHVLQLIDTNTDQCYVHGGNHPQSESASSNGTDLPTVHRSKGSITISAGKAPPSVRHRLQADKRSDSQTKQDSAGIADYSTSTRAHVTPSKHDSTETDDNTRAQSTHIQQGTFGTRSGQNTKNVNIAESAGDGKKMSSINQLTSSKRVINNSIVPSPAQTQTATTGKSSCATQAHRKTSVGNPATSLSERGKNVTRLAKNFQDTTR